jgi:hypothetical protein
MADEKEDPARQQRAHLEEWLKLDDKQRALRPYVTRMLGTATWEEGAMDAIRRESPQMATEVDGELSKSVEVLKRMFPLPRDYGDEAHISMTSTVVSSTATVFETLVAIRGERESASPRISDAIGRYEQIVDEQGRAAEAGQRLQRLFPSLNARFTAVQDVAVVARGNPREEERAAMDMRTFLDKLKGELFAKAYARPGENMTWEIMAKRLAPATGSQVLADEGRRFSGLIDTLSNIGKARHSAYNFTEVWTRFVDHVYVVCGEVLARAVSR